MKGRHLAPPLRFLSLSFAFFPFLSLSFPFSPTSGPSDRPLDPLKAGPAWPAPRSAGCVSRFDSLSKCMREREPRPSIAVIDAAPNPGSSPDPILPAQDFRPEARVSIPWGLRPDAQDRARVSQTRRDWGSGLGPPAFALMRPPDAPAAPSPHRKRISRRQGKRGAQSRAKKRKFERSVDALSRRSCLRLI